MERSIFRKVIEHLVERFIFRKVIEPFCGMVHRPDNNWTFHRMVHLPESDWTFCEMVHHLGSNWTFRETVYLPESNWTFCGMVQILRRSLFGPSVAPLPWAHHPPCMTSQYNLPIHYPLNINFQNCTLKIMSIIGLKFRVPLDNQRLWGYNDPG